MVRQPRQPLGLGLELDHPEEEALAFERSALDEDLVAARGEAEHLGDVIHDPAGRRRGRGEHRRACRQLFEKVLILR